MSAEAKVWTVVIVMGVLVIAAAGIALIFRGDAIPTAVVDDTPPPYYYDAEHDRYWHPDHGHWHRGRPPEDAVQEIGWLDSLEQAAEAARADNSLILAYFHAEWCGLCQRLKEETYTDSTVREKMSEFTLLQVDIDLQMELAQHYEVEGIPATLFLNADGEELMRRPGFMPPESYLEILEEASELAS